MHKRGNIVFAIWVDLPFYVYIIIDVYAETFRPELSALRDPLLKVKSTSYCKLCDCNFVGARTDCQEPGLLKGPTTRPGQAWTTETSLFTGGYCKAEIFPAQIKAPRSLTPQPGDTVRTNVWLLSGSCKVTTGTAGQVPFWTYEAASEVRQTESITKTEARTASQELHIELAYSHYLKQI